MENARKVKRGEVIFKENDAANVVYLIQSGKIGLMVDRSAQPLEVTALGPSQTVGDQALISSARHEFSAMALQECKILEVPVEIMKQQYDKTPPGIKIIVKSLIEEIRQVRKQMKMTKLESEKTPCPQGVIHRIFTQVHLTVRHIGKKDEANPDQFTVNWKNLKLYATRFFGESPQRLRSLMDLLLKLNLIEVKMEKNEEGEEDLSEVKFLKVQVLEDFAEFFQYHLFKGSRAEAIYVDSLALKVAKALSEISVGAPVDHKGASKLDYQHALNECKAKYRIELKNTHLDILEKKGLFATRKSFDDGRVELHFDRTEFVKMAQYWSILFEIDKWNERGMVDLKEKEEAEASGAGMSCQGCSGQIDATHKFCPHCGFKLAA
jgi:CRP-like cAMP-binding protein